MSAVSRSSLLFGVRLLLFVFVCFHLLLLIVARVFFVVRCCCLLLDVCCSLFVARCALCAVCCLLLVLRCALFAVRCLFFVACCLLFNCSRFGCWFSGVLVGLFDCLFDQLFVMCCCVVC